MNTQDKICCYLCGSTQHQLIFKFDTPDIFEKPLCTTDIPFFREWHQCDQCGLMFTVRSYTDFSGIYQEKYRTPETQGETLEQKFKRISSLPENQSDAAIRARDLKLRITRIRQNFFITQNDSTQKILDIGSGINLFLSKFLDKNWEGLAIEADVHACEFSNSFLGIKTIGEYYKKGLIADQFDLISLIYILEHLEDPVSFLKECISNIKMPGLLYICVPDTYTAKVYDKERSTFCSPHYMLFNPRTLTEIVTRAGLFPIEVYRRKEPSGAFSVNCICTFLS